MQPENTHGQPANPWSEYADLDAWGSDAVPQYAFALSVDSLKDGDYDFEIVSVALDKTDNGSRVLRANLAVLNLERRAVQYTWWLNRQESVNSFLADMAALGFPAQTWGTGPGKTPLSVAIPATLTQLRGLRFRASKTSRNVPAQAARVGVPAKEARTYHDFRVLCRSGMGNPMPPAGAAPVPSHDEVPF